MRSLKIGGVIFGAIVITTLGINASDMLTDSSTSLLGQLSGSQTEGCPVGTLSVPTGGTFSCIQLYEASPNEDCPVEQIEAPLDTQENLNEVDCASQSVAGVRPWTYVNREQAEAICRRSGMRLPSAAEWHHVAIGTPDDLGVCNIDGSAVSVTGSHKNCLSALGGYDFVGNAWEWMRDDVFNGTYNGLPLPEEGFVTQATNDGVAVTTENKPGSNYGEDYFWSESSGVYGMLRGGYFGSRSDAGIYAVQARTKPTTATPAIGFRCVL